MIHKTKKNPLIFLTVLLAAVMLVLIDCKNSTSNEEPQANILVSNECGAALDVFMNGDYKFSLEYREYNTIQNVATVTHELVAKMKGTETLVLAETVEIISLTEHVWTVLSSADLTIANQYGETLNIYGDGSLQGEIDDGQAETLGRIPYGEHVMEARKLDGTVVASITLLFDENKEYIWTITQ